MKSESPKNTPPNNRKMAGRGPRRWLLIGLGVLGSSALAAVLVLVFALAMAYPNLPPLDTLTDYRPKMP